MIERFEPEEGYFFEKPEHFGQAVLNTISPWGGLPPWETFFNISITAQV